MEKRFLPIYGISALIFAVSAMFFLTGCSKNKTESESQFNFDSKYVVEEGEDGWLYFFCCNYSPKGTDTPDYYGYSAYNLKYKEIEGYVVPTYDEDGNIIDTAVPALPYLELNQDYAADIEKINTFFNTYRPTEPLTEEQTADLELEHLDKDKMTDLFNRTISSEKLPEGKYYYLSEANIVQEDTVLNGYRWQVGYFNGQGNILSIRIELIYADGTYLSDIAEEGIADETQLAVNDKIAEIEGKIMEEQIFSAEIAADDIDCGNIDFSRLAKLLGTLEANSFE